MRLVYIIFLILLPFSIQAERSKVKIGMLLTLSGSFATAGEDCRKGIEAGLMLSNAHDLLDIVYADSKNEPKTAIGEFQKLVNVDKVLGVYTLRSSIGMPLNPVSSKLKVPLLAAAGHKEFATGNEFSFQIWPKSDNEGAFLADEFAKRGYRKVAMIYTEDEWTSAVSEGFREKSEELGISLAFDQSVLLSETNFRTLLLKVKKQKPDAIYINLLLPQIGPIMRQAYELEIVGNFYTNFYATRKDVLDTAGAKALEGLRYVEINTDLPHLKSQIGNITPSGLTVASYLGTILIAQAVSNVESINSNSDLQTALLQQKEIRTPDHIYSIQNRVVQFPLVVKIIRDGKGQKEG